MSPIYLSPLKIDYNNYMSDRKLVCNLVEVGIENVGEVGGKNASLGEMIKNLTPKGIRVSGFGR